MPQAPQYLREMFDGDAAAYKVLAANFSISRGGVIYPNDPTYIPTEAESNAIDYLWLEWDYCYSPTGQDTKDINNG
jgi:hypothetical protein